MSSALPEIETARAPRPAYDLRATLHNRIKPLASLRFTVALFALSMVLVFFGTLAMMTGGLWTVVGDYFRSFVVWIPVDLVRKFGTVFLTEAGDFPKDASPWPGKIPFPAGWTIGFLMLVNLTAAHVVRFKMTWKRSGIILLHAGVILLMLAELATGLFAVESTMTINKGETTDFLDVTRDFEVAIIDSSDSTGDRVTVVPYTLLTKPGVVSHPDLPFELRIEEYWKNTTKEDLTADELRAAGSDPNVVPVRCVAPMIKGVRLTNRPEAAGVDGEARSDAPSVRLTVLERATGTELGTFLLSLWAYPNYDQNRRIYEFPTATATTQGKPYTLQMRNKRVYLPYSVELINFEHGKYPGTDIAKDFASTVRVSEKDSADAPREVRIWMNNPLRYAGRSFFQFAVLFNDSGTVLQVVKNPARWWPYVACGMVTVGLIFHFLLKLVTWLRKPQTRAPRLQSMGKNRWAAVAVNGVVVLTLVIWLASGLRTPKAVDGFDWYEFGRLPVRDGGRVMPLDTLARTTLQSISGRTEVQDLEGTQVKTKASAIRWLADVLDSPNWRAGPGAAHKVFKIDHDQLLAKLELPRRPGFYRYSLIELEPKFDKLMSEFDAVQAKRETKKALDLYDSKVEDLGRKLKAYQRLARGGELQIIPPTTAGGDWTTLADVDDNARTAFTDQEREIISERADEAIEEFTRSSEFQSLVKKYGKPDNMPESVKGNIRKEVQSRQMQAIQEYTRTRRMDTSAAAGQLTEMLDAARGNKAERFQVALAKYKSEQLGGVNEFDTKRVPIEAYWLDHFAPFYRAEWLYLFTTVLALLGWLFWRPLNWAALTLALFTVSVHGSALGLRMWVMWRPPVTNLYASAVFIGFGAVVLCLLLEAFYRNGLGNLVAGAVGAATTYVANFLGGSGDTMAMLQAVLDTNFWLTVHVITVTLGYTATFVGGALATLFLVRRLFPLILGHERTEALGFTDTKEVSRMTYGVLCFAMLLSFFGTVSGGIWGDESWGRFWGWDPKENGAVLIVIWNALILHARWCGLVKDRGVAALAVVGNMVTAWSWFGTNQLQLGLHSYGFDDRLAVGLFWYWASQLGVLALAFIPVPPKSPKVAPPIRPTRA